MKRKRRNPASGLARETPKRRNEKTPATVADLCAAMEAICPTALAQSWDNVGLIAGDPANTIRQVLLCIDLAPVVVDEAIDRKADAVVAYHPPIFKPVASLRADSSSAESAVFRCVRNGIALYSPHTALDAADGGTNDALAGLCGIRRTEPLLPGRSVVGEEYKLVVFVPAKSLEAVASAMFAAGAGRIGDYSQCSFRTAGIGTFFGGAATNPAIGKRGRREDVDEIRLETVVPTRSLAAVVAAMIKAHPYEEPAFDLYPLRSHPEPGIGRSGMLARPTSVQALARKLRRATRAANVQVVGRSGQVVQRAVFVAGAAGDIPFQAPLSATDVIVTGEIRHHDALRIRRIGCAAIALGHWASERPVLAPLAKRLKQQLPRVAFTVSRADRDPFESA